MNVSYSLEGRPANSGARWRFDKEAINIGFTSNKNFLFPGRHLIESIVVDQSGYFRKLGLYQNISPNKFNKGQTAVFQFSGLKRSPPKVTAMMGLRKFILTKSDQDPELFSGEIPSDSAGNKLIAIPEFNFKGSFNLVVLPTISNPDAYIGQSIDQLIALLDSINGANQSYLNSKASLGSLLDELRTKILLLSATDKQKVAEYLQANIFADLQGLTSFKQIKTQPSTFFGLLIASAYAQNLDLDNNIDVVSPVQMRGAVILMARLLGAGFFIAGGINLKTAPYLALTSMVVGAALLISTASASQDLITDVHNIDQNSLYLKLPNQVNSDQVVTFSVWGQAVPLESIAPASPLISQSINAKNNANFELGRINSQLNSVNSTLSLLGFSSQVEPLPLLSFPQTRFPTILSTNYITNVQLLSSEDGQASILSHSKSGNNLLITFKSTKTQSAKLRVTYVNADLGINKNIDTDIIITVAPKAVINYTKNNLVLNFDSTDPEDPNASGLTYSWDFGDGQTVDTASKTFSHTYAQAGTYTVVLIATDEFGASSSVSVQVVLTSAEISFFLHVNPQGTYLFTDTVGGYQPENNHYLVDISVPATRLNLNDLYNNPEINLRAGDYIKLQAVGSIVPTIFWPEDINYSTLLGVFRNSSGGFLYADAGSNISSYTTPVTYPRNIPTDIAQDFLIPFNYQAIVKVPTGATSIDFSVADNYFADNSDPNGDYGVTIKITIVRGDEIPLN